MQRTYLSAKEFDVLQAKSKGYTDKEVAERLGVSLGVVKRRIVKACKLLKGDNVIQVVGRAISRQRIQGPSVVSCVPWVHTEIEQRIRDLLITGATCKEMSAHLGIADYTIATRIDDMRQRDGARNRIHLAAMIIKVNLPK